MPSIHNCQINRDIKTSHDRTSNQIYRDATLKSLETQVEQISQVLNTRPMRGFPSNTKVAKGPTHEQCKAISKMSGRILDSENKQGEKAANSSTTAAPAEANILAEADEDHTNPSKPKQTLKQ
ncbi:hypothetical protein GQ457_06G013550 [Hibiscus cannabinus]